MRNTIVIIAWSLVLAIAYRRAPQLTPHNPWLFRLGVRCLSLVLPAVSSTLSHTSISCARSAHARNGAPGVFYNDSPVDVPTPIGARREEPNRNPYSALFKPTRSTRFWKRGE